MSLQVVESTICGCGNVLFFRAWVTENKGIPNTEAKNATAADLGDQILGSEQGVFWRRGLFRKVRFLEILGNLEIPEILENPRTVENRGESDHVLEILENLLILEILEIPLVKRPLS